MTSNPTSLPLKASKASKPFTACSNSHLFFFIYVARSIIFTGLSSTKSIFGVEMEEKGGDGKGRDFIVTSEEDLSA